MSGSEMSGYQNERRWSDDWGRRVESTIDEGNKDAEARTAIGIVSAIGEKVIVDERD